MSTDQTVIKVSNQSFKPKNFEAWNLNPSNLLYHSRKGSVTLFDHKIKATNTTQNTLESPIHS